MDSIRILHRINNDNYCEREVRFEDYRVEYNESTLLCDIVHEVEYSRLNIRDYYDISLRADLYKCDVPYLIQDGMLRWNVDIKEVKVIDILTSHNIQDTILVESYIVNHGGYYNLMDIIELWESILPILMEIAQYLGVLFVFEKAISKIGKIFIAKKVSPINIIEFILRRESWNHNELALLLELESEQCKYLLKSLGYKWDNSRMYYVNHDTKFIHNKFTRMSVIKSKEFKG